MSANVLTFRLKKEVELDKNLKPMEGEIESISLYACIDGIWGYLLTVKDYKAAKKAIRPDNIEDLFAESLSDVEYDAIMSVLSYHPEYYFFDEVYEYKN
jgi:hypothetical protein